MSDLFWLTEEQLERMRPHFPEGRGRPRVDDRRVLSGIIHVNRNRLRWGEAPADYGPPKTLHTRWKRWSEKGVFADIFRALADDGDTSDRLIVHVAHLMVHHNVPSGPQRRSHEEQVESNDK